MTLAIRMQLDQLGGYPIRLLPRKALGRLRRCAVRDWQRLRDHRVASYDAVCEGLTPVALRLSAADIPDDLCRHLAAVAPAYLAHRFNLLGSGWVRVAHGVECAGFDGRRFAPGPAVTADRNGEWLTGRINRANLAVARRLWRLIRCTDYSPIDWQLDFKSGFRWGEQIYFSTARVAPAPGADIKVPRELARMQHLPELALCALRASAGDPNFSAPDIYLTEIRAQLLDFIATNPPRFGVNWACTMDVAIRVANWLLTFDLLASAGLELDAPVREAVAGSVSAHARHIAAHLEWSERYRTNHYLADVVGLLYVAARVSRSPRSDAWLAFAVRELMGEALVQFYPEGSCYEGSTSYHCLSAQMLLFGVALCAGLPTCKHIALAEYSPKMIRVRPPFPRPPVPCFDDARGHPAPVPPVVCARLWRAARFCSAVTRPDGRICQIGDTDSGRLFKLHPMVRDGAPPAREELNHETLVEAVDALFHISRGCRWFESAVVRALAGSWLGVPPQPPRVPTEHGDPGAVEAILRRLPERQQRMRQFPYASTAGPWRREAFSSFGLYIFRRDRDFVSFRCAAAVAPGTPTGHLHDDNLGIEIMLDGSLLTADPGTYVYTADPVARDLYRGASAHDLPRALGWAVAPAESALFSLHLRAAAECICWRSDAVAGRIVTPEGALYRLLRFRDDALEVWDGVIGAELAPLEAAPPLCEGYGRKA